MECGYWRERRPGGSEGQETLAARPRSEDRPRHLWAPEV
jgi:hypothetical protein